ncbi:MAG: ABC transporter ATP-binding protein [Clostridia bacterium]|nr:ABC transporter ATP-binding protein [Clostridia bacterium]
MDHILSATELTKIYSQGEYSVKAVDNCGIHIEKGTFNVIVGASGSGKTTLLHLLSALERPTSGQVMIGGRDIFSLSDRELSDFRNREIGIVFQSYHLLPVLTARENIIMPTLIGGNTVSRTYLDELCQALRLTDRLEHLPSRLSGGQQQRVAIARAMINRPSIIFADEPTGNLDKQSAEELMELLLSSGRKFGQTVLMVTHDRDIAATADRIYEMDCGRIRQIK